MAAVDQALTFFEDQAERIRGLVGLYLRDLSLVPEAALV